MTTSKHKRTAQAAPTAAAADWSWGSVRAALASRGLTLASLAATAGLTYSALSQVKNRCYPGAQAAIAQALDLDPWAIWPSRYYPESHEPKVGQAKAPRAPKRAA